MRKFRAISIVLLILITVTGVCGCMNKNSNKSNRQEPDQEYILLMQNYIQNKYSITVDVVEQILPQDGINTALKENVLIVRDSNGVISNVKAKLSTPYEFYDDYVEAQTAASIQNEIGVSVPSGTAKIYVVVNNSDANNIDTSSTNIASLTFVSTITGQPNDNSIESLYKIYNAIQQKDYSNVYFLVGFTDGSSEFEKAVENYMIFGKSEWKDYSGEVFAELYVTDNNLSYAEFKERVN